MNLDMGFVITAAAVAIAVIFVFTYGSVGLWITALFSGVRVSIFN
ncbi:MAG: UPF0365 family protein, partial [Deltaproteobacteria bacterium]